MRPSFQQRPCWPRYDPQWLLTLRPARDLSAQEDGLGLLPGLTEGFLSGFFLGAGLSFGLAPDCDCASKRRFHLSINPILFIMPRLLVVSLKIIVRLHSINNSQLFKTPKTSDPCSDGTPHEEPSPSILGQGFKNGTAHGRMKKVYLPGDHPLVQKALSCSTRSFLKPPFSAAGTQS